MLLLALVCCIIQHMPVKFSLNLKNNKNAQGAASPDAKGIFLKGGNDRAVILIHGVTGTPLEMGYLAKSLNKNGYSIACPLLANHGGSLALLKRSKWQDFYRTVQKAFLDLKSENRPEKIFIAGLSIGALLALILADQFKDDISGVSCLSPTIFYDGWNIPWSRQLLFLAYFTPLRNFFYFKEEPPYGIKNEAIREVVHKYYSSAAFDDSEETLKYGYPYIPMTLLHQHYLLVKYFKQRLPHLNIPTQLIQARNDDMTSVRNSQFIYDRIGSAVKEIILLDNSYHVITADYERDKVAQEMERFYASL